jgi:hypothetical protein
LKSFVNSLAARIGAYAANDAPLAAAGNKVALVLAGNTPFYPLYVVWLAGSGGMPWLLMTLLVFPVFLAVPAIARRNPLLGRVTLSLAGTGNTLFCSWLLGEKSATELFFLPCITLSGLLFGVNERAVMLPLAALPLVAWYFLHGKFAAPPYLYPDDGYAALFAMNAISVGTLSIFLGIVFSSLYAATPKRTP